MSEKSEDFVTLHVPNNLHLANIDFPKFKENATIPEELNEYLRSQLQHMKSENETLHQQISKQDLIIKRNEAKIQELSTKIKDYGTEFVSPSQLANTKIVELTKKLREKNSEIEVYKSKCLKLENNLLELRRQIEANEQNDKKEIVAVNMNNVDEVKKLQDKLTHITNKWTEEKNHNLQLKNDLKKASKWLQQEVGDKFETLLALNGTNSTWRGRAQIICDLQQKNQELKEKLKAFEEKKDTTSTSETVCNSIKINDQKIEQLTTENTELRNSFEDLRRKYDNTKARYKALETDFIAAKSKLSSLHRKIDKDQETITKLTNQISCYNQQKDECLKQKEETIKILQQENDTLKVELIKEKCVSENKSKELAEKNDDIQILNKRIRNSRPPSAYVHKRDNPETKTVSRLEAERLRLLELTQLQNGRLQEERNAHLKTQHLLRAEKQRAARLEANVAMLQLEQNSTRSGYSSKISTPKQPDGDIKDKLELAEENMKALSTRLELEILERKNDLEEFSKILQNYDYQKL